MESRTRPAARAAQDEAIRELAADVLALTEPPPSYQPAPGVVTSPSRRGGALGDGAWIAIVGHAVECISADIPYERMAAAARVEARDGTFIVYCSVLPWLAIASHAPEIVRAGETSLAVFERLLGEQVADIVELGRRHRVPVIWAGDFNQSLAGPIRGGATVRRVLLSRSLASLGYTAWNSESAHASLELCAVDLICGPDDYSIKAQGRLDPRRGDIVMSDHAGYWVDL